MNCKKNHHFIFAVFLIILTKASVGLSEVLRWPQICPNGELSIQNKTTTLIRAWLQSFNPELNQETELPINAGKTLRIQFKTTDSNQRYSILHFEKNGSLKVSYLCPKSSEISLANSIEGGIAQYTNPQKRQNKLWLQNLTTEENTFTLNYFNFENKKIFSETLTLNPMETKTKLIEKVSWMWLQISSDKRAQHYLLTENSTVSAYKTHPQPSQIDHLAKYFLIAPRDGIGDSFVAKISDQEMIEKARDLIQHPEKEKMLFAKITKGHQGYNRNWSKPEKSFWSWSISEVTQFADLGSTACNGLPQAVEDRVDQWLQDPGRICFWNYRVKKEISISEIENPN